MIWFKEFFINMLTNLNCLSKMERRGEKNLRKLFYIKIWCREWILLPSFAFFFSSYIFNEFFCQKKSFNVWLLIPAREKKINKVLIILFLSSWCLCFFLCSTFLWVFALAYDFHEIRLTRAKKLFKIQLNVTYSFLVCGYIFVLISLCTTVFIRSRMFGLRFNSWIPYRRR